MGGPVRNLLCAIATLILCACGEPSRASTGLERGAAGPGALTVLTYNVNFEQPSDATARAIVEADADMVFLQETHPGWERRIRAAIGDRYPHVIFHHAPDEGGMAILSRFPITEQLHRVGVAGVFPSWRVTASTPLGSLDVLHVHLHPPLEDGNLFVGYFTTGDARREELLDLLGDRTPDLVLGDFNEGEGDAVAHLRSLGLREAQRQYPPVERTWTWRTGPTELEGRPDHVFVGPALRAAAVRVMQRGGSDHRPLRVALQPAGADTPP